MAESETKPLDSFVDFVYEATRIFKAFSMALDPRKLIFALAGVMLWAIGAMVINLFISGWWWLILVGAALGGTGLVFLIFARTEIEVASKYFIMMLVGSIICVWVVVVVLFFAMRDASNLQRAAVCQPLWALAVASLFGTAIARIAAMNAATEQSVGFRDAMRFALKKLATSVWTLLVPPAAVLVYWIVLVCLGFPGRVAGFGHIWYFLIGLVYILFLLGGLFFALVMVMYLPGLALFQPAIGAEGQDAYDAITRAYSYIFNRPWRLLFYGILAYAYGRIILSVGAWIVVQAGWIANAALSRGVGDKMASVAPKLDLRVIFRDSFSLADWRGPGIRAFEYIAGGRVYESFKGLQSPGSWLIVFWQFILLALFMSFALSLFYCLATQVYFLMRKASYGTPFEEVYIEQPEEEEFAGEFAETPKPAEVKAPSTEEAAAKEGAQRAKVQEEKDKPIELEGIDRPLEEDEDAGR